MKELEKRKSESRSLVLRNVDELDSQYRINASNKRVFINTSTRNVNVKRRVRKK